jgi:hypothetical protein
MKLDSDTMNATERAMAIINHTEPDRLPTYLMGFPPYSKVYKEYLAKEDEIFNSPYGDNDENILLTPLGDFTLPYYFGGEIVMYGVGINFNFNNLKLNEDGTVSDDLFRFQEIPPGSEAKYVDYEGAIRGIKILPEGGEMYTWYEDGYLKTKEQILDWFDRYGWPHEKPVNQANVQAYNDFTKQFGDRLFMIPAIGGCQLYESTWPMMGQARWAYYCRKDPDFIHQLVDSKRQCQLKILDELAKLNPAIIFGGDDMGQKGRPMVSPDMYRKFFFDPYKDVFDKIHEMGAIAFNHSCGNIVELLPLMIEAGINGWQSLEPASEIDHAWVKQTYGDKLLLVGGIDSREISFGTPESISDHVHKQILAMGHGGGYIPGPTHDFLTEVSYENVIAFRDAVFKWGKYPLEE